jgi:hypothetical protein
VDHKWLVITLGTVLSLIGVDRPSCMFVPFGMVWPLITPVPVWDVVDREERYPVDGEWS